MTKSFSIQRSAFAAGLAIAFVVLNGASVQASSAGSSLGACYDRVTTACNRAEHPSSCSAAGVEGCDDLHANNLTLRDVDRIRIVRGRTVNRIPTYRVILETSRPLLIRPTHGHGGQGFGGGGSGSGGMHSIDPMQSSNFPQIDPMESSGYPDIDPMQAEQR